MEALKEKIEGIETAMLTTIDLNGRLRSRPMATMSMDENGALWFFTNEFSGKVHEVMQDTHVCVSFAHPGKNTYVSVSGEAELITDKEKMKELWMPVLNAWFPKGLDDPNLSLLKVNASAAEYWDSTSSGMVQMFQIAKAIIKGEKYDEGEHEKVNVPKKK